VTLQQSHQILYDNTAGPGVKLPVGDPEGTGLPAPENFYTRDLYAPAVVSRATTFNTVTYHDQTKNFRGGRLRPKGRGTVEPKLLKHILFPRENLELQNLMR